MITCDWSSDVCSSDLNILFYQKCGFRVHAVRPDYFWYYDEPLYENGLLVRDMIVFRHDLGTDGG
jgi:hypothetical protein